MQSMKKDPAYYFELCADQGIDTSASPTDGQRAWKKSAHGDCLYSSTGRTYIADRSTGFLQFFEVGKRDGRYYARRSTICPWQGAQINRWPTMPALLERLDVDGLPAPRTVGVTEPTKRRPFYPAGALRSPESAKTSAPVPAHAQASDHGASARLAEYMVAPAPAPVAPALIEQLLAEVNALRSQVAEQAATMAERIAAQDQIIAGQDDRIAEQDERIEALDAWVCGSDNAEDEEAPAPHVYREDGEREDEDDIPARPSPVCMNPASVVAVEALAPAPAPIPKATMENLAGFADKYRTQAEPQPPSLMERAAARVRAANVPR